MDRRHFLPLIAAGTALATLSSAGPALAYIGPGVGAGVIGAITGVIGAILLGLFAVIWYPVKRMMRRRKAGSGDKAPPPAT